MNNFNPMQWQVATPNAGGLPPANYKGAFVGAEHLPAEDPDEATGHKGRNWASIKFKWEITDGEHKGKAVTRETPVGTSAKCAFAQMCGLVMGKQLSAKDAVDLTAFVGRDYVLTIANQTDKNGNLKTWTHVVNAMLMP